MIHVTTEVKVNFDGLTGAQIDLDIVDYVTCSMEEVVKTRNALNDIKDDVLANRLVNLCHTGR